MHSLYLCYFGLREPLVQTQVLPYLRELRKDGHRISLLTFEPNWNKWTAAERSEWRERLAAEGISWIARTYHKRPTLPATLYDIAMGAWTAGRYARREKVDLCHARGHVPALMGLWAGKLSHAKLLFDIRGFLPEEYVDAGNWPADGFLFRGLKRVERRLLTAADGFVVLTEKAQKILFTDDELRPVQVIPCCVDLEKFVPSSGIDRDALRAELGIGDRVVMVYSGGLGGWYLSDAMADLFAEAHQQDPRSFALILTQSDPAGFTGSLRARGFSASDFLIRRVSPTEVPRFLSIADRGLMFIKPSYSKQASSPTKLAEYLACGLPVICNAGVGDVDEVIETDRVGVLIRDFTPGDYREALARADALLREAEVAGRCRTSAEKRFDLAAVGGERYRSLYRMLAE
jgi:glycosyltransferase involved in cell wall biosynthesis